ncbi:hypothetical protein [Nocardioides zhouii]|uniref:DUF2029 domain-containing protein n=1 Tax=Nocardioides zhouii TaxID=1168729 RepID=A0A4Q2SP09_9ACTN|nr:hypothetical protein [Nocardioides zhouii]RYC05818.1 hypothetical protein EUA94_17290 [Nocardioides zhouii]
MKTLAGVALGLTRESRLPDRRLVAGMAAVGLVFLLLPRLEGWTLLHVHKEDGVVFLADFLNEGWSSLIKPYTGYQHLVPRTIAGVCATGPTSWFAGCVGVSASLVRVALAVVALAVVAPYARSPRWAIAAAAAFIWAPVGQQEALGNLTNLRWFLDAGAVVLLLGTWRRGSAIALISVVAVGAAMTDPLSIVIAPLAAWRIVALRGRERLVPGVFLLASVLHFLVLQRGARSSDMGTYYEEPAQSTLQVLVRGLTVPLLGQNGSEVLLGLSAVIAAAAGVIAVAVLLVRVQPTPATALAIVMAVWGGGLLIVTLTFTDMVAIGLDPAWKLGQGSRYSVPPGVLVAMGVMLVLPFVLDRAAGVWRVLVLGVLLVFPLAVLADSPGDPANTADPTWSEALDDARETCSGRATARVQMTPADVPMDWSVELPCDWLTR